MLKLLVFFKAVDKTIKNHAVDCNCFQNISLLSEERSRDPRSTICSPEQAVSNQLMQSEVSLPHHSAPHPPPSSTLRWKLSYLPTFLSSSSICPNKICKICLYDKHFGIINVINNMKTKRDYFVGTRAISLMILCDMLDHLHFVIL